MLPVVELQCAREALRADGVTSAPTMEAGRLDFRPERLYKLSLAVLNRDRLPKERCELLVFVVLTKVATSAIILARFAFATLAVSSSSGWALFRAARAFLFATRA